MKKGTINVLYPDSQRNALSTNSVALLESFLIVFLTGAYRNAGDHLHHEASLNKFISHYSNRYKNLVIVGIDRKAVSNFKPFLDNAFLIVIPGGPTIRSLLIPEIIDLDECYYENNNFWGWNKA